MKARIAQPTQAPKTPPADSSDERLRLALEAGEMGTWEWQIPEGRVIWSETLERIHGLVPGTFGGTFEEYGSDIHPDDRGLVFETVQRTLAGAPHRLCYRIIRPDGDVRWLEARATLVRDADGTPRRLVGICADVTEKERAAERMHFLSQATAILASSLDYRTTVSQLAQLLVPKLADWYGVQLLDESGALHLLAVGHVDPAKVEWAWALQGRFQPDMSAPTGVPNVLRTGKSERRTEVTDEMLQRAALNAEHLEILRTVGMTSILMVPLIVRDRVIGVMSLVSAESGRRYTDADQSLAEELAQRAAIAIDNARLFSEVQAAADRTARLQAVTAGLARALTVENVAETVVREGMTAFQAVNGSLCRVSDDGCWLEIVHAVGIPDSLVREFSRFSLDAEMPLSEAVRTREPVFLESRAVVQARYPAIREANLRTTGESWIGLPLVGDGAVIGALTFGLPEPRAFTPEDRALAVALGQQCAQALERARLHDAELAARARADEANRVKTEFLAVMSHELRTPLNAIAGYAELLEIGVHGPLTDAQREDIVRIQRSQRHLLSLINDVLNFARIDAGHVELELRAVPVNETLAALEALVAPQVRAKQLRYEYEPCDPTVTVHTDAEKLRQILLNLLSNAIKFTAPGGRIAVSCQVDADRAWIRVADSGRGIPADKLDRIFEPFVQLDAGRTRANEGTGLGLAISRDLARAMGGEIGVESTEGVGSTFTLTLGRRPAARA